MKDIHTSTSQPITRDTTTSWQW